MVQTGVYNKIFVNSAQTCNSQIYDPYGVDYVN